MSHRRGFTLIELLVVIAIIAILAAILFPVFARARAKAQQNNCLSNVKQICLAWLTYTSDYDQRIPGGCNGADTCTWGGSYLGSYLKPYLKNQQILLCPSTSTAPITWNSGCGSADPIWYTDYLYNSAYLGQNGCADARQGYPPLKDSDFMHPAETWNYADGPVNASYSLFPSSAATYGVYYTANANGMSVNDPNQRAHVSNVSYRHNGGANFSFCDGHAKWLSLGYAENPANMPSLWQAASWQVAP